MNLHLPLAAGLLVFLPSFSAAQPAGVGGGPRGSITVEAGSSSGSDLADGASRRFDDVDVTHFGATVSQNFSVGPQTGISLAFEYERFDVDIDQRFVPLPEQVQSLAVKATGRRRVNERWTLLATVEPGFANADDPLDSGGFGLKASVLGLYRQSDTFTWAIGVIYRSLAESDLRILPAFGFDWRPNRTWNVLVGFPRTMVTYAASETTRLWFGVSARGGTYYLKDGVGTALSSLPPLRDTLLDYTEIRLGPGVEYRPTPAWVLSAAAGLTVHQNFEYFERDYELEADDPTLFVGVGAAYSF